jgi:hypothetical protein
MKVRLAKYIVVAAVLVACSPAAPGPMASEPSSPPTVRPTFSSPGVPTTLTPEAIRAEVEELAGDQLISIGYGAGRVVSVGLRSTGEDLASQIHATYGEAVEIAVGLFPYPPPNPPQRGCLHFQDAVQRHPPLATIVAVEKAVVAGTFYAGTVRITNTGLLPFQLDTSSNFSLFLFRPGDSDPTGLSEGGSMGTGFARSLDGGESVEFPASGGTASCDLALGYVLPAGTYAVRALIEVLPPEDEVIHFWSEPTAIEVVAP